MGLVHSTPGPYFPVPGCSTIVLEGFLTQVRLAAGISHQRGRYMMTMHRNTRFGENPDTDRKCDPEPEVVPSRHSHAFRMVPACVVAVPTHGRPAVMKFSVGFMQNSVKFRQNTPETAQKCSNVSMGISEDLSFAHTATIRHPRAPQLCRAGSSS